MKKRLSRRAFLRLTGFASVAGVCGYSNALGGTRQSRSLPEPVLAYRRVVKSKDIWEMKSMWDT